MKTRGPKAILAKIKEFGGSRKPIDIFVPAEIFLQMLNESEDGVERIKKGEYRLTFANEERDTLDFTIEETDDGTMVAISKFAFYTRYTDLPDDLRIPTVIEALTTRDVSRAKTPETVEKTTVVMPAVDEKKRTSSMHDAVESMSDEELEAILAARRGNAHNEPEKEIAVDSNATDSDSEPEAEEQIEANGNEAEDEEQNDADDSATDSDSETEYEESDDDDDGDDEELYKHKRRF